MNRVPGTAKSGRRELPTVFRRLFQALPLLVAGVAVTGTGAVSGQPSGPLPGVGSGAIAVLPFENYSGFGVPEAEIRDSLKDKLRDRGIAVLEDDTLDRFMRRNRMRHTGGLAREMGEALRSETGSVAVLVASLDLYDESGAPAFAFTARLVAAGGNGEILWMDSESRRGDQAPGFLGRGLIYEPLAVEDMVLDRIVESLSRYISGVGARRRVSEARNRGPRRFRPKSFYRTDLVSTIGHRPARIAVLPFSNSSTTRHAGEILRLQVIRFLVQAGGVEVIEPGEVRQALLRSRLIQEKGPSIPQSDVLQQTLQLDLVLFGEVMDYREAGSGTENPIVEFSVRAIDTARRQVIWSSISYGKGDDKVFFFGLGRVPTAHDLASRMARGLIARILSSVEEPE